MLINITFAAILEKSSVGEFQARNSNGMVYPYLREVMNKPFQRRIQSPHSILRGLFLMLLKGFPSLCIVTRSSVLVAVGVLYMLLHFIIFVIFIIIIIFVIIIIIISISIIITIIIIIIIVIIIFIIFIIIRIFIKSSLLFLSGKFTVWFCFF